jgi:hypothetical protein
MRRADVGVIRRNAPRTDVGRHASNHEETAIECHLELKLTRFHGSSPLRQSRVEWTSVQTGQPPPEMDVPPVGSLVHEADRRACCKSDTANLCELGGIQAASRITRMRTIAPAAIAMVVVRLSHGGGAFRSMFVSLQWLCAKILVGISADRQAPAPHTVAYPCVANATALRQTTRRRASAARVTGNRITV